MKKILSIILFCFLFKPVLSSELESDLMIELPESVQEALLDSSVCGLSGDIDSSYFKLHSKATSQYSIMYQSLNRLQLQKNDWQDDVQALFVDEYGRIREDTNSDLKLSDEDYIVEYLTENEVEYFQRSSIINDKIVKYNTKFKVNQLKPIWKASDWLNIYEMDSSPQRNYESTNLQRYLFTYIESRVIDFTPNQTLLNYQSVFDFNHDELNVEDLIHYVRGQEFSSARIRMINELEDKEIDRLGGVINDSLVIVNRPHSIESLKKDDSYQLFLNQYQARRNVVYIGSNDGMLHAFNAGFSEGGLDEISIKNKLASQYSIGSELWGFIPEAVIPKLKKVIDINYQHNLNVDSTIQSYDVKIFNNDPTHPAGWGTILVYGVGKKSGISESDPSVYYVLDVTNPEAPPVIMAEIKSDNLGHVLSSIKLIKQIDNESNKINVKLAFFSVEDEQEYNDHQFVFLYDLKSKLLDEYDLARKNSKVVDFTVMDLNLDGIDDVFYMALNTQTNKNKKGNILRFHLDNHTTSNFIAFESALSHAPLMHTDNFNQTWLFQGTSGRLLEESKDDELFNYFIGVKEPVNEDFKLNFDAVLIDNLVETTNINVSTTGDLLYSNSEMLFDGDNNEIVSVDDLMGYMQQQAGWKVRLTQTTPAVILSPPILNNNTLYFEQFLTIDNNCNENSKSLFTNVDFRTGVADFNIKSLAVNSISSNNETINDEVIINEFEILRGPHNTTMLNYTKSGVQIMSSNDSGSIFSNLIEPVVVGPKRLGWKQLY